MFQEALAYYHALNGADGSCSVAASPPASPAELHACEQALGTHLPLSFRRFCEATPFLSYRFLPVRGPANERGTLVGENLILRRVDPMEYSLDPHLVAISPVFDGDYLCLDTSRRDLDGECPVVHFHTPDAAIDFRPSPKILAASFEQYAFTTFRTEWGQAFTRIQKRFHQSIKQRSPISR